MNTEIDFTLRCFARASAERGVDTLSLMRAEYRLRLNLMVERGYGDAASLNAEASEWASDGLGPCPDDRLERAAWWTVGLGMVQAQHEYRDPNLA